ncbi:cupredoxin domain-containing protein [Kitasatospora sp. NPDC097643]|uniref:cupredoxin domain-containing protein n=1 Tax=Kitasatospora sp. NPDC097643 TaxID=3157230 RepID=UPI003329C2D4
MRSRRLLPIACAALLAVPLLAACSQKQDTGAAGDSGKVAIAATDTACDLARTEFPAGQTTFAISNKGSRVTEVYVFGEQGGTFTKVVSELENIGPGTSRDLAVTLAAGSYEVACKPGQTGDGIRKKITVGGGASSASPAATTTAAPTSTATAATTAPSSTPTTAPTATATATPSTAYDREIEVEATEYALEFEGMAKFTAKTGERIEFQLENKGTVLHDLQFFGPDGTEVGQVAAVQPGQKGEAVITLTTPGTYTVKCGIGSHAAHGMQTTFTVG